VQLYLRVRCGEFRQMANKPPGQQSRRRGHEQTATGFMLAGAFNGRREALQALTHLGQHCPAFARQFQRPRQAMEQVKAEVLLKATDLVTDRCWRHRKLGAGVLETQVASRRFKGTQGVEGRQTVGHMDEIFSRIN
jgi:hypothetical protein